MLADKDIEKLNKTPEKIDKLIMDILSSKDSNKIITMFSYGNKVFFDYLISKNYIIYFNVEEIKSLLDNYYFLDYLFITNKELFNNILKNECTSVIVNYIETNINNFIDSSIYLYDKSSLLLNNNIVNFLINNAKTPNEFVDLINNISDNKFYKNIISNVKKLGIVIDVELLNVNALSNIDVANYLVFDLDLNNIKYIKNDAYQKTIYNLAKKINNHDIDLSVYKDEELPLDCVHKLVLESISSNKDYYYLLKYFPSYYFDAKINYHIFLNSSKEKQLNIINDNKSNIEFFRLYLSNINNNSLYLDMFEYEKMDNIEYDLIKEYENNNKYIRELLLKKVQCNNMSLIHDAIIAKEKDPLILENYIKSIDAFDVNKKTLEGIYSLIITGKINIDKLNNTFFSNNNFLNINIKNGMLINNDLFNAQAYEVQSPLKDEKLLDTLSISDDLLLTSYYLKYLNVIYKDNNIKKSERKLYSLLSKSLSKKDKELIIYLIENGKRNPLNVKYINDEKDMYVFLNMGNIVNNKTSEYLKTININQLKYININHYRTIYNLVLKYIPLENTFIIAYNMYLTLGFDISLDLLNNKYGLITPNKIEELFGKINIENITFIQNGNSYIPNINTELLKTIFGNNYKSENTPIKFYLDNYLNNKNISEEYINNIKLFFNINFNTSFLKWDLIKEEYIRKIANSNIDVRLNIKTINELISYINKIKPLLLNYSDIALKASDVINYAGINNQYVLDYKSVPSRIVTLSRNMENINYKTIPDVSIYLGNYHLFTLNPKDRNMLALGYKADDCFRAMGVADNFGSPNSLLEYVTSTPYSTCIEVVDNNDNFICFSPVYRNGNVLLINSIECPKLEGDITNKIYELLRLYSQEVINITKKEKDNIDYIMITDDGNNFCLNQIRNKISNNKFHLYDPKCMYSYASLNDKQYLFEGSKNLDNIKYDYETNKYIPNNIINNYQILQLDENELELINKLLLIKNKIIEDSNIKFRTQDVNKEYSLTEELKYLRGDYLNLLETYAKEFNINNFDKYQMLLHIINEFDNKTPKDIINAYFNDNYYILNLIDNTVIYNYKNEYKEKCMELLNQLKKENDYENVRKNR